MRNIQHNNTQPMSEEAQANFYDTCKGQLNAMFNRFIKPIFHLNYKEMAQNTWNYIKEGFTSMINSFVKFVDNLLESLISMSRDVYSFKNKLETNVNAFSDIAKASESFLKAVKLDQLFEGNKENKTETPEHDTTHVPGSM